MADILAMMDAMEREYEMKQEEKRREAVIRDRVPSNFFILW